MGKKMGRIKDAIRRAAAWARERWARMFARGTDGATAGEWLRPRQREPVVIGKVTPSLYMTVVPISRTERRMLRHKRARIRKKYINRIMRRIKKECERIARLERADRIRRERRKA